MPRIARIVVPGASHHVTQRGNDQQAVFFVDSDRRKYLNLLREQSQKYGLRVAGFCLMTNHIHLVAVPEFKDSLAKAIGRTHYLYTQYVNQTHDRSGHLWQNRFFSCPCDEDHARNALAYVELNPVYAGMIARPWDYQWSSASAHCLSFDSTAYRDLADWQEEISPERWRETLRNIFRDQAMQKRIQAHTYSGRPLGSTEFVHSVKRRFKRGDSHHYRM